MYVIRTSHTRDRDDPVFETREGQGIFLFSKSSRPAEGRTSFLEEVGRYSGGGVKFFVYF
jgi:hypothetical protein